MKKLSVLLAMAALLTLAACGSGVDPAELENAKATASAALAEAQAAQADAAKADEALAQAESARATAEAAEAALAEAEAAVTAAEEKAAAAEAEVEAAQAAQAEAEEALTAMQTAAEEALQTAEAGGEEGDVVMIQGRPLPEFYLDTCGGCHGAFREGTLGPALIPERLPSNPDILFAVIKNGRPGTSMDPFGGEPFLEDPEIEALVEYILSEPTADAFVWGEEQIRDSIEFLVDVDSLPDEPTHDGNIDNLMLVTERENRSIKVFDADTNTDLGRIEATYRAHGYTFDPSNPRWAYNLGRDGWLLKIDLFTLQPVAKTRIGIDARAIAISDDGKYVIGGNYIPNSAVILDTETMEPVKIITTEGNNPSGEFVTSRVAGINATSSDLVGPYFLLNLKDAGQVWRVDYSDLEAEIVKLEDVGEILHESFLTPDQKTYYVASQASNWMAVIDVENMELVDQIKTHEKPHPGPGAVWTASDGKQYAATVHIKDSSVFIWDTATNEEAAVLDTPGPGLFIVTNDQTPYVWADALFSPDSPNTFFAIEKDPPFTMHPIEVEGAVRVLHPEPSADGKYVYVSDWPPPEKQEEYGTGKVYVFDANTFELVTVFEDVVTPTGIFNSSRRYETLGH